MTNTELFVAFGNVDEAYRNAAINSMQAKKSTVSRPRLRSAIIAATLALLVALIPIAVILANHTPTPPPPVTTPLPDSPTPSTHLSITDIPGAFSIDNAMLHESTEPVLGKFKYKEFREFAYEKCANFLGTAISSESVMIHYPSEFIENRYLHLTVAEIKVTENIRGAENIETVKVAYPCFYYYSDTNAAYVYGYHYFVKDLGLRTQNEPFAFYSVCAVEDIMNYRISELPDNLKDYADYFLVMHASYYEEYGGRQVSHPGLFYWNIDTFRYGVVVTNPKGIIND